MFGGAAALLVVLPLPALADTPNVAAYLKARAADADGRSEVAVAGYARALSSAPGDAKLAVRAFREALAAGDMTLASRAAAILRTQGEVPADVALLAIGEAAQANDPGAAERGVAALDRTPLGILSPAVRGWIASAKGVDPMPVLGRAAVRPDPLAQRFANETRALLLIARGDTAQGLAAVAAARSAGAPADLSVAAAQLLFGRGQEAEARALLDGDDPVVVAMRRGYPAKPTLAFGVSRLFGRVAADLAGGDSPSAIAIALSRSALVADPTDGRARLLLADALARDGGTDRALATLAKLDRDDPFAAAAQANRVAILAAAGRSDEALAAAKALATREGAVAADWQRYGEQLTLAGQYAEAARWYRRVLDADAAREPWTAWMQYGGALDQAGRWAEAKPALERAVKLAPDEPLALNYLGYARAERGDDVRNATRLLERAAALAPDNASIADSLGWVYFLGGNIAKALPLVERAAAAEPDNAEIAEHLGDIYWSVGRRYEARYAWRAAAVVAEPDEATRLAGKVASGLPTQR
nr:tetratricopeptide repeat protein [Sphingomonas jinjuensis]